MNGDLISRSALKKALKSNCDVCNDKNTNWCERCCPKNDFEDLIDNAPAIEPFERIGSICEENCGYRPQGKWRVYEGTITCEECGKEADEITPFCAWCGADMRRGGAE